MPAPEAPHLDFMGLLPPGRLAVGTVRRSDVGGRPVAASRDGSLCSVCR